MVRYASVVARTAISHEIHAIDDPTKPSGFAGSMGASIRNSAAEPSSAISGATSAMMVNAPMERSAPSPHCRSTYRRINVAAKSAHPVLMVKDPRTAANDAGCPTVANQCPRRVAASTVHQRAGGVSRSAVRTRAPGTNTVGGSSAVESAASANRLAAA